LSVCLSVFFFFFCLVSVWFRLCYSFFVILLLNLDCWRCCCCCFHFYYNYTFH
jgi:hypothetical protein